MVLRSEYIYIYFFMYGFAWHACASHMDAWTTVNLRTKREQQQQRKNCNYILCSWTHQAPATMLWAKSLRRWMSVYFNLTRVFSFGQKLCVFMCVSCAHSAASSTHIVLRPSPNLSFFLGQMGNGIRCCHLCHKTHIRFQRLWWHNSRMDRFHFRDQIFMHCHEAPCVFGHSWHIFGSHRMHS